ncbi:GyrI-like domain-containing protein [Nocardioides sp. R1-1]|uniref:GyrI-like domain-containing protein n=1 Tax=Nocardioides sp. R1-1 TaxID=3383502 RepID=UPI0038D0A50D
MRKTDFKRELRELYAPTYRDWRPVDVPALRFLMVDGAGDPNRAPRYREAVEVLFGLSYRLKFLSKAELGRDHVVMPLEGLWWADDPGVFVRREKDAFRWTMLMMQPDWVSEAMLAEARSALRAKADLPALGDVRLEEYDEGRAVQLLHVGPYDDEGPVLARLHEEYLPAHGLTFNGHHHEIYLGDPRRSAPERLRTILRQPVRPVRGET